ncbi:Syndecan-3 [Aix galericulata]|nr:Syndecan-3 [Aix galericulata]
MLVTVDGLEKGKGNPTCGRGRLLPRSPDYETWLIKPLWHAQSFHRQASGCEVLQDVHAPIPTRELRAQRWRNENYERPVDLEGSGDDDPFGDDELDDVYSGSGSGCE